MHVKYDSFLIKGINEKHSSLKEISVVRILLTDK